MQAIYECEPPCQCPRSEVFLGWLGSVKIHTPIWITSEPFNDLTRTESKFQWGPAEHKAFEEVKGAIKGKDTNAFFNHKLPIMVRAEASYNEGLSGVLFQKSAP